MAKADAYLVPIDFSRASEKALTHALSLARQRKGKVFALHVIPAEPIYPHIAGGFDFYRLLQRDARSNFEKLAKRKRLSEKDCELILARGMDFADSIARQAKNCACR